VDLNQPLPQADTPRRKAGMAQGITVVITGFLPILAIISMFPAVPAMIQHFSADPLAPVKVPSMVSAPGLTIAIVGLFVGMLVDRFGRRRLLLTATLLYGVLGALPFLLESLDAVYASRLALGVAEAVILTTLNTLIADYWDENGRRNWLTAQGLAGPLLSSVIIYFAGSLVEWRWNAIFLLYLVGLPIFLAVWAWMYEPTRPFAGRPAPTDGEPRIDAVEFPWALMAGIGGLTLFSSALYYVFIINGGLVWQELGIRDAAEIGRVTALPSLLVLLGAALFWIQGRLGLSTRVQMVTFLSALGLGLVMIGRAENTHDMILALSVQQTGTGMAVPVLIAWAQSRLPAAHRGRGMGVWAACFFFGQFSSPLLVGVTRSALPNMQSAFVALGAAGLFAAVLVWFALAGGDRKVA
jgi:MFS family permease